MLSGSEPISSPVTQNWLALKDAVGRFERAWRETPRPTIDDYLTAGDPFRFRTLVELVHIDLELRLKAGEAARVEEYLTRFAELSDDRGVVLELITTEHELRRRREPDLGFSDYLQRFPEYRAELSVHIPRSTVVATTPPVRPTAAHAEPPPEVAGYEVLSVLGRGGMGVVHKARDTRLNRIVALKLIRSGARASPDLRARFSLEAEALATLQHPNIVQVYDYGEFAGSPYLVMEFLDGGSLNEVLAGATVPPAAAAELVETLAQAMHAAHQRGIVHRDLKPANILMRKPEVEPAPGTLHQLGDYVAKVTDFGLAKHLAAEKGQTESGVILGTPSYMAPEQARGHVRDIGPATDVYALGAILYEMLTGRPPFQGETGMDALRQVLGEEPLAPSRLRAKVPADLETICLKCLQKEPASRYPAARDLADDLRRFRAGEPIAARPAGLGERAWKWARRRPVWAALIGVIFISSIVTLAACGWSYVSIVRERNQKQASLQVARQAVDGLYTKMAAERLFDEPQLDPLCQELLERGRTLYEGLAREHGEDLEVRRDVALAWFRLGEIHRLRDQRAEAEAAYREAIARQEALCRDTADPRLRRDLANSHNWLGELLREHGNAPGEAEQQYRAALDLQQELVANHSEDATYRMELARSHYNLAIVERDMDRVAVARGDSDRAVALMTELHGSNPSEANYRQDLARALVNRGVLCRQDGAADRAKLDYDRAIDILTRLHRDFPARAAYASELAVALQDRANLYWSQGRQAEAQREHGEALALLRELVTNFAGRPHYRKKTGIVLKNLGSVLAASGDRAAAERTWEQARTVFEELCRETPESADYQGLLGMTLGNLGWLRTDEKNWSAARQLIEQGIDCLRAALRQNPRHPEYRLELRNQYQDVAWTFVQLNDPEGAARAANGLAEVFPDRAQDRYYGACFLARCVPLARDEARGREYADQAAALLRDAAAKASPRLNRIPDEKQVFGALTSHPDVAASLRALDALPHN